MTVEDTRVADDWYVGFHTGLIARFWRAAGATMAEQDARVVAELLALPPGSSVIDVPVRRRADRDPPGRRRATR